MEYAPGRAVPCIVDHRFEYIELSTCTNALLAGPVTGDGVLIHDLARASAAVGRCLGELFIIDIRRSLHSTVKESVSGSDPPRRTYR